MSSADVHPVVVGFDGSERATNAVRFAAQIAVHQGESLVVLHAADRIRFVQDAGVGLWTAKEAHDAALRIAERGAQVARDVAPDLDVTTKSSLSSPAAAMEEVSLTARMIVVGNSGRGRVSGILLGSTAYHVASIARCPVTIVPAGTLVVPGPDHKVSVATDGSPSAARSAPGHRCRPPLRRPAGGRDGLGAPLPGQPRHAAAGVCLDGPGGAGAQRGRADGG